MTYFSAAGNYFLANYFITYGVLSKLEIHNRSDSYNQADIGRMMGKEYLCRLYQVFVDFRQSYNFT
jgi:hypothetical protein